MIQQEYKNNIQETSGTIETTGFNIEVNPSMFQMLTSNVYNDPKLAVMREWSTNACDACIAADKEVRFEVHLPTLEETFFSVRDYGTGLSPEDVTGLFSNLGASTKRNSDKYNGTLGIGRMAGLAIADAFTVDSYYNGTQYSYVISMKNGVPVTMSLGNNPTTEPNGLLLKVSTSFDDIEPFRRRASNLYKFFDYKPILNIDDIVIDLDISEHISDDWFIAKETSKSFRGSNYVVMSQVAYEIPYSQEINTQGFRSLVIKVAPGTVTFNPGRESLSLNKSTADYVNKRFKEIAEEYVEAANNTLALCNNDFELMTTYKSISRACPSALQNKIDPGQYASDYFKALFHSGNYYSIANTQKKTFNYLTTGSDFIVKSNNLLKVGHKPRYYKTSSTLDSRNTLSWDNFFFAKHVVIDLKSKFRSALNEQFKDESLVTWQRQQGEDFDEAVKKAKEYLDNMGISYQLASSLITQENLSVSSIAPREGFYASTVNDEGSVFKSEKMKEEEITANEYLFLKLKNTTPILQDSDMTFEEYQRVYFLLSKVTTMPKIKGVAKKYQEYVESLDNWMDYETYIKSKVKEVAFKLPAEDGTFSLYFSGIDGSNKTHYPSDIAEYYEECKNYKIFTNSKEFLSFCTDVDLVKSLKGNFISYQPIKDIDLRALKLKYPKTLPLITRTSYYGSLDPKLLAYIANLEEFYAIHSPK